MATTAASAAAIATTATKATHAAAIATDSNGPVTRRRGAYLDFFLVIDRRPRPLALRRRLFDLPLVDMFLFDVPRRRLWF